jgi:hypothetical protein
MDESYSILPINQIEDPRLLNQCFAEVEAHANNISLDEQNSLPAANQASLPHEKKHAVSPRASRVGRALRTISNRVFKGFNYD